MQLIFLFAILALVFIFLYNITKYLQTENKQLKLSNRCKSIPCAAKQISITQHKSSPSTSKSYYSQSNQSKTTQ